MKLLLVGLVFSLMPMVSASNKISELEIQKFFSNLTDSLNSKNAVAVSEHFVESGEMITLAGGIYKGREEIANLFQQAFDGPYKKAEYEYIVQFVRLTHSNHAVIDGIWKIKNADLPASYPSCGIFLSNLSKVKDRWHMDLSYSSVPKEGHTADHGRTISWKKVCSE